MLKTFLVADIGGTNSRFSVFKQNYDQLEHLDSVWLKTDSSNSFLSLLHALKESSMFKNYNKFSAVTIAAAGPVNKHGICNPPNIKWNLSLKELEIFFPDSKVYLINDFLAQSFAVLTPIMKSAKILKEGLDDMGGVLGVIGPGTGLGKSLLSINNKGVVFGLPSEGGHVAFAAISKDEFDIINFIKNKIATNYVTAEHVVSGRSLSYLFEFFYQDLISVSEVADKVKLGQAPLVVDCYSKFLARVCRDFALDIYSNLGIVIAGGVLSKTPEILNTQVFISEFTNSSTQFPFLDKVKVSNFSNEDSGLWGAAKYASQFS